MSATSVTNRDRANTLGARVTECVQYSDAWLSREEMKEPPKVVATPRLVVLYPIGYICAMIAAYSSEEIQVRISPLEPVSLLS